MIIQVLLNSLHLSGEVNFAIVGSTYIAKTLEIKGRNECHLKLSLHCNLYVTLWIMCYTKICLDLAKKNPPNIKNNLKMNKSMNLFGHSSPPLEVNAAKLQGALSVESICVSP